MLGGKASLSPAQRQDFYTQAQGIYRQASQMMQGYEREYTRLATESGIPASKIVVRHPRLGVDDDAIAAEIKRRGLRKK